MPTPFDDMSLSTARDRVGSAVPRHYLTARAFFDGDHWQRGQGWIGPRPAPAELYSDTALAAIEREFLSTNAIGEVVNRHLGAVIGRPPTWTLTVRRDLGEGEEPTPEEQARIAEASALLQTWWDAIGLHTLIRHAAAEALIGGRGPLRLFVPPGLLVNGVVPRGDLATQFTRITVQAPRLNMATITTDDNTLARCAIVLSDDRAEISYVDGDMTILRVLTANTDDPGVALPLGGALLLEDIRLEAALVSPQVMALQRALNLCYTMLARNVVLGGFLERVLLNAQLPGTYETAADGTRRFVPEPFYVGAGTTNVLLGAEIKDPNTGEVSGYATPSVVYRDPVPVTTFADSRQLIYHAILNEVHQLHAAISGDATASGQSRIQAMADFLTSVLLTAPAVERVTRWVLETGLALASHFAGQRGRFADLRMSVQCRIDPGPLSAEETQIIIALVNADLLSRETAMSRARVDDVDAEQTRISTEREARMTLGEGLLTRFDRGAA